ncbi:retrovirus-related pol polyprotein from transposon TNT 1-94 [Tanacetum coccineum]
MSSIAKFDVEKFDGSNDFGLWRVKMWCILIQYGWEAALDPFPGTMTDADKTAALKTDVYKKAHSALLLCLDNKVLREVNKENSAAGVWLKLETLYMTKSLANKLYLKKKLFTFYMHSGKNLSEHIDEFNKLIGDLTNIDVDIDDKDQALMLLTSLPSLYDNFVETLLYGRESLTLEYVLSSLNSWELKKSTYAKDDGDGLYVRGKSDHQDNQGRGGTSCLILRSSMVVRFCLVIIKHVPSKEHRRNDEGKFEAFLHELERRDVLGNKGLGKLELCENYVLGKSNTGASRVKSMSGCRYFLSIVDDYSRRVWVHFLRHKNEAFRKFKEWKELVENQTGRKLKKLRTDNGLEFCNQEFNNLCTESGIARHLTVSRTPQKNGLAERMNRMLLNKVRCLVIQSGFSVSFWAEATMTVAYLINMSPSTTLEKKTPMDLWSSQLANYEMLRIFGCVAYSHINQGKLKPRAIKCIFLGYPDGAKGYRLWRLDDVKPKIIISRDVVFNESLMYKDTLKGVGVADFGKEVEFEVELQGSRVEPTVDPHTRENPGNEDEEQDEEP